MQSEREVFLEVYQDLEDMGKHYSPRGMDVVELEDYMFTLQPYDRFTSFKQRNLNMDYVRAELRWYMKADPYDDMITEHAQIWKDIRQPEGNFFSNYGQYIFGHRRGDSRDGAQFVIDELIIDRDSRRAVIPLLAAHHLFQSNKDVVCTYSISFRIRDRRLNMSVNMRSNDAVWGMTNDVACFSLIQEIIFIRLKAHIPDLEMGTYTHKVDSLHVYERHFDLLRELAQSRPSDYERIEKPRISSAHEVHQLFEYLKRDRPIKTHYEFTKWLLQ